MTTGMGGLVLHLWVIFGFTLVIAALLTSVASRYLLSVLSCFDPAARQRFIWCIAVLPWLLGLVAGLLVLLPSAGYAFGITFDHCYAHGDVHSHLCWFHPLEFVWISWEGLSASVLMSLAAYKAATGVSRLSKQYQSLRALLAFADQNDQGMYILASNIPSAFTAGLVAPKILLSSSLVAALSDQELRIVQRHEQLHQQRRDPLKLWLFNLLLAVFLPAARRDLLVALELNMEKIIDAEVSRFDDSAMVAITLIKVSRLNLQYLKQQRADAVSVNPIMCAFGEVALEERIQQLLKTNKGRCFPRSRFLMSLIVLMAAAIYYADGIHHVVEIFFYHHH